MAESHLKGSLVQHRIGQILEFFPLPAIQTRVVHFHDSIHMLGTEDEFLVQPANLLEFLLIIHL